MADVLPRKRQAEIERFQNRLTNYKRHSLQCENKFKNTFEALVEHDLDQTQFLQQKFVQSKEKRAAKKKLDTSSNTAALVSFIIPFIICTYMYIEIYHKKI